MTTGYGLQAVNAPCVDKITALLELCSTFRYSGSAVKAGTAWVRATRTQHFSTLETTWHMSQAVAILMLTTSSSDADMAAERIAISYPPICKDMIVDIEASDVSKLQARCALSPFVDNVRTQGMMEHVGVNLLMSMRRAALAYSM